MMNYEIKLDMKSREKEIQEIEQRKQKAKHNYNFVQIEKRALGYLNILFEENPTAGKLLLFMAQKMNKENSIMISNKTLADLFNCTTRTVRRSISYLKDHNWIQIIRVGTSNAYLVNSAAFWQSHGDKKITSFNARIIASSDEQEESIEELQKIKLKHFPFVQNDG